ncbi:MAG: DMT family transporter [Chthoniobacterales bacterium]
MKPARLLLLTSGAMVAFAGNSLLCRAALRQTTIDPASFTFIRLLSGAVALSLLLVLRRKLTKDRLDLLTDNRPLRSSPTTGHSSLVALGTWTSAAALFVYAAAFSFAYVSLPAATGALLLFGAVQATMILWGLRSGESLRGIQIPGLLLALGGLVALLLPGLSAPPLHGATLMLFAGIAWGIYSQRGKGAADPAGITAGNFIRAVPLALILSTIYFPWTHLDRAGVTYAILSGACSSGLGYVIWYAALPSLKAISAATVQLSVPVLAAGGGILLLGEAITLRFVLASIAILGGIALVIWETAERSGEPGALTVKR